MDLMPLKPYFHGAIKRKEAYATTGPRMLVRVFGGWNFDADDLSSSDFVSNGYQNGVPMGGDLANAPDGASPGFLIRSLRDPDGANLDRVQIIKGWIDEAGETHERVYDVAVSDDREIGADHHRPRTEIGKSGRGAKNFLARPV